MNLEILKPFCGIEVTRYALKEPWYEDGFAFASDARIIAAIPHEFFDNGDRRPPKGKTVLDLTLQLNYTDLPPIPICDKCKGAGILTAETCKECNGKGYVNHECDCELCNEDSIDCDACNGTGGGDSVCDCYDVGISIDGQSFTHSYLQKIAALPDCQIVVVGNKLYFRSGELRGLLAGRLPQ